MDKEQKKIGRKRRTGEWERTATQCRETGDHKALHNLAVLPSGPLLTPGQVLVRLSFPESVSLRGNGNLPQPHGQNVSSYGQPQDPSPGSSLPPLSSIAAKTLDCNQWCVFHTDKKPLESDHDFQTQPSMKHRVTSCSQFLHNWSKLTHIRKAVFS